MTSSSVRGGGVPSNPGGVESVVSGGDDVQFREGGGGVPSNPGGVESVVSGGDDVQSCEEGGG